MSPELHPQPEPEPLPAPKQARARPALKTVLTAGLALLAVSLGISWLTYPSSGDRPLSAAEQMIRLRQFQQAGALSLPIVHPTERAEALDLMNLPDPQRQLLQQRLDSRDSELVWLTLWDNVDQDGDVVAIESNGFRQTVNLLHAPQRVAIPRPADGVVNITGVHDGGGGITIAVKTMTGDVVMPVMAPGQAIVVRVR